MNRTIVDEVSKKNVAAIVQLKKPTYICTRFGAERYVEGDIAERGFPLDKGDRSKFIDIL